MGRIDSGNEDSFRMKMHVAENRPTSTIGDRPWEHQMPDEVGAQKNSVIEREENERDAHAQHM